MSVGATELGGSGRAGSAGAGSGKAIGVLVSGTGTNLQALLDAGLPVVAVASNRGDAPALARAGTIPTAAFELADYDDRAARDTAMADWLAAQGVQLVVLAGYMHLLTAAFLDRFPGAVVNVHPSLLPAFPGARAVEEQLAAGVRESGATVHLVDEGVDSGPILAQERVSVRADDTPQTLHRRIKDVEHALLPRVVGELCAR
jgi:phosphoribosylglycinamide formyltransferase 1